jgi:hypothetical protein
MLSYRAIPIQPTASTSILAFSLSSLKKLIYAWVPKVGALRNLFERGALLDALRLRFNGDIRPSNILRSPKRWCASANLLRDVVIFHLQI